MFLNKFINKRAFLINLSVVVYGSVLLALYALGLVAFEDRRYYLAALTAAYELSDSAVFDAQDSLETTLVESGVSEYSPIRDAVRASAAVEPPTQTQTQMQVHDVGLPEHFSIPKINVDARILHIGYTSEGAVGVPEGAFDVSWFSAGPRPGEQGSSVISGHTGIWRNGNRSIFDNLHTLTIGDVVHVYDENGSQISFAVKKIRVYGKDDKVPEIFQSSDRALLNIITCHGTWLPASQTYSQRLVVFTERI